MWSGWKRMSSLNSAHLLNRMLRMFAVALLWAAAALLFCSAVRRTLCAMARSVRGRRTR